MSELRNKLSSVFGEKLNRENPLPEHPRRGKIPVPFSPETALSGVGRMLNPDEVFEYRKNIVSAFQPEKERLLLHFGAVDQECEVFVNGEKVGEHKGGYTGFSIEISDQSTGESNL